MSLKKKVCISRGYSLCDKKKKGEIVSNLGKLKDLHNKNADLGM